MVTRSPSQSRIRDREMDDRPPLLRGQSRQQLLGQQHGGTGTGGARGGNLAGVARHTLGLILLLCVVFLWTMCNFLGSSIFADNTYAKPFFLTYLNTSTFMVMMVPNLVRLGYRRHRDRGDLYDTIRSNVLQTIRKNSYTAVPLEGERTDQDEDYHSQNTPKSKDSGNEAEQHLALLPTAKLSFMFCLLWFGANYFAMSCLQYTTVASVTILTSTSSFWTLLVGALMRTEKFTWRKLFGVAMSFAGILLISKVDLAKRTDADDAVTRMKAKREDTFPDKPATEIALGDALALISAILYGVYTISLKKATLKALPRSINMPLFFGFVGMFNFVFLMPVFPILHYTGLETFAFPPTSRIWTILIINSISSLTSDICWAYAMVLTSPLLVTVGLSLTIPLSLVGEMVLQGHYEGWVYWVGASIVVGSFLFIDQEEKREEGTGHTFQGGRDLEGRDPEGEVDIDEVSSTGLARSAHSGT